MREAGDAARADTVAIVGTGVMGLPVLRHLVGQGFACRFVEPDDGRAAAAAVTGARRATGPAELTDSSAVLLFVPTDADVLAVAGDYLPVAPPGSRVVVCSSVLPETCLALAREAARHDVRVVDAALTGGVRAAEAGTINLLVGGEAADVLALRGLLSAFSAHVHHLGALGAGQVGKTVNNLLHWAEVVALAEALSLGAACGVAPAQLRAALATGPTDSRGLHDLEQMRFTWFEKDIDNAVRMAAGVGRGLPLGTRVQQLMRSVDVAGMAELLQHGAPLDLAPPDG
jgi:3-hydroxyisobutyrate dehydrogenase-like beta-hydroxyacid dehydrogenase